MKTVSHGLMFHGLPRVETRETRGAPKLTSGLDWRWIREAQRS
jgi:hypothetical protein